MYLLTNKDKREIGLPSPKYGAVIIPVGDSVEVSDDHYRELIKSRYSTDEIERGAVVVKHTKNKRKLKTQKRGVKLVSQKGGLWKVYVNGHSVSDVAVSKEEAQRIVSEYE